MYKFVNHDNLKSSKIDFSMCVDYVDQRHRPKLVSEMVDEFTRTGQLPNTTPLRPLQTQTDDIESFSPEYGGSDKIDSYIDVQNVMSMAEGLENRKKEQSEKLQTEISKQKAASRQKIIDEARQVLDKKTE